MGSWKRPLSIGGTIVLVVAALLSIPFYWDWIVHRRMPQNTPVTLSRPIPVDSTSDHKASGNEQQGTKARSDSMQSLTVASPVKPTRRVVPGPRHPAPRPDTHESGPVNETTEAQYAAVSSLLEQVGWRIKNVVWQDGFDNGLGLWGKVYGTGTIESHPASAETGHVCMHRTVIDDTRTCIERGFSASDLAGRDIVVAARVSGAEITPGANGYTDDGKLALSFFSGDRRCYLVEHGLQGSFDRNEPAFARWDTECGGYANSQDWINHVPTDAKQLQMYLGLEYGSGRICFDYVVILEVEPIE